MSLYETAIELAKDEGLDLVEVCTYMAESAGLPCDGLWQVPVRTEQERRSLRDANRKQVHVKEIKFRPGTDEGDYQIKLRKLVRVPGKMVTRQKSL